MRAGRGDGTGRPRRFPGGRVPGPRAGCAALGAHLLLLCCAPVWLAGPGGSPLPASFFTIRPWTLPEAPKVRALIQRVQGPRGDPNPEGPQGEDCYGEAGYYDGEAGVMLVACCKEEDEAEPLLACAAVTVGFDVTASGRGLQEPGVAFVRRVCVDLPWRRWRPGRRRKLLEALLAESARFARAKQARCLRSLGYQGAWMRQPSPRILESLGYHRFGWRAAGADGAPQRYSFDLVAGIAPVAAVAAAAEASEVKRWRPSFAGRWKMDLKSSDSLGEVFEALVPSKWDAFALTQIVDRLSVEQVVEHTASELSVTVCTPLKSSSLVLPFNGTMTVVPGPAGGSNNQTTRWSGHKLKTVQAVEGDILKPLESLLFVTTRSLGERGSALLEDVKVVHHGATIVQARRVLRRVDS